MYTGIGNQDHAQVLFSSSSTSSAVPVFHSLLKVAKLQQKNEDDRLEN